MRPLLWAITALWTLLLALWTVLPPTFYAPDEPQHVDTVIDAVGRSPFTWVAPDGDTMGYVVSGAQEAYGYLAEDPARPGVFLPERRSAPRTAEQAVPRDQRPGAEDLVAPDAEPSTRTNQMYQHPPLYYRVGSWVVALVPNWREVPFDRVVGLLRLLSVVMLAPLPLVLADIARSLNGRPSLQVSAALTAFVVPQVAHLGSVVTNDAPLMILSAVLTALLARVYVGDRSPRMATFVGVCLLAVMLTKGFALVMPLAVVAAYIGSVRGAGGPWRARLALVRAPLLRVVAISALSVLWYGENVLRFGELQPSVLAPPTAYEHGPVALWGQRVWMVQAQTFWGRLGWAETGFGTLAATVASAVLVVLVARAVWRREGNLLAMLLLPGTIAVTVTIAQSWGYFDVEGTIRAVHGRYFFTSIAGLLVLAAAGLHRLVPRRLVAWAWVPVLAAGVGLHGFSWVTALRHWWTTPATPALSDGARALLAWQPWPPRLVQVVVLATVLVGLDVLRRLVGFSAGRLTVAPSELTGEQRQPEDEQDHVTA